MANKTTLPNPLIGQVKLSTGIAPTPYRVMDGRSFLIGGTADLKAVKARLAEQQAHPIEDNAGRALVALWLNDYFDTDLGPHVELQLAFLVSKTPLTALKAHSFGVLKLLVAEPKIALYTDQLWTDTEPAMAYKTEHLGLPANLCNGSFAESKTTGSITAKFSALNDHEILFEAQFPAQAKTTFKTSSTLLTYLGPGNTFKWISKYWFKTKRINPIGPARKTNLAAQSFLHGEKLSLQPWQAGQACLKMGLPALQSLGFKPQFIASFNQAKFLHLNPAEWELPKKKKRSPFTWK